MCKSQTLVMSSCTLKGTSRNETEVSLLKRDSYSGISLKVTAYLINNFVGATLGWGIFHGTERKGTERNKSSGTLEV